MQSKRKHNRAALANMTGKKKKDQVVPFNLFVCNLSWETQFSVRFSALGHKVWVGWVVGGRWRGKLKGNCASVDQGLLLAPESFLLLLVSQITFFCQRQFLSVSDKWHCAGFGCLGNCINGKVLEQRITRHMIPKLPKIPKKKKSGSRSSVTSSHKTSCCFLDVCLRGVDIS